MKSKLPLAKDFEDYQMSSEFDNRRLCWYPANNLPSGIAHGSSGLCLTNSNEIVLIRMRNHPEWGFPAGRPEGDETLEETLRREIEEEACAVAKEVSLLGYVVSTEELETGESLTKVRAHWKAKVDVQVWNPNHEIEERRVIPVEEILHHTPRMYDPFYVRQLMEAGIDIQKLAIPSNT